MSDFFHRASAAFLAISRRFRADSLLARALPPFLPRSMALGSFSSSSASPVAICMTRTAFPITSAGRLAFSLGLGLSATL